MQMCCLLKMHARMRAVASYAKTRDCNCSGLEKYAYLKMVNKMYRFCWSIRDSRSSVRETQRQMEDCQFGGTTVQIRAEYWGQATGRDFA